MKLSASLARAWDAFATNPDASPLSTLNPHPSTPPHPRPNIRDIIAGVKLPNTAEQAAMIKGLGLKTVEPTIKLESPFRAVAPPVDEAPAEFPTPRPLHQPSTLNHQPSPSPADPLVPFSSIRSWCDSKDAELATAHAHIAELENKLRWSHQRETALREELAALS